jgi:Kef-type K+ transport system membrane component KefB
MLLLAGSLTLVAIVGKQACSLAAFGDDVDRLSVGIGMIPRGEVGLIFAKVGTSLTLGGVAVVSAKSYAACVFMVMVTTLVTPPLLAWSLGRRAARRSES